MSSPASPRSARAKPRWQRPCRPPSRSGTPTRARSSTPACRAAARSGEDAVVSLVAAAPARPTEGLALVVERRVHALLAVEVPVPAVVLDARALGARDRDGVAGGDG